MATIIDSISWEVLLQKLRQIFEKDCVDVEDVKQLLALYTSDPNDWQTYTKFDPHRYKRKQREIDPLNLRFIDCLREYTCTVLGTHEILLMREAESTT